MHEPGGKWKYYAPQLTSMHAAIDKGPVLSMFTEVSGDRNKSPFGGLMTALFTKEVLAWQQPTSIMLQEYASLQTLTSGTQTVNKKAFGMKPRYSGKEIQACR